MQNDLVASEVPEPRLRVEVLDLGGNQDLEVLHRKPAERANAALAALHAGPEVADIVPDRRHHPLPGNNDSPRSVRWSHASNIRPWLRTHSARWKKPPRLLWKLG